MDNIDLIVNNDKEWRRHILTEIAALRSGQDSLKDDIAPRLAKLEVKAGFWGIIGGIVVTTLAYLRTVIIK